MWAIPHGSSMIAFVWGLPCKGRGLGSWQDGRQWQTVPAVVYGALKGLSARAFIREFAVSNFTPIVYYNKMSHMILRVAMIMEKS